MNYLYAHQPMGLSQNRIATLPMNQHHVRPRGFPIKFMIPRMDGPMVSSVQKIYPIASR